MQIVGDSCADLYPGQIEGLPIRIVPLTFTLDGITYKGGVDIDSDGFYKLISATKSFPTTSQPSVGDFEEVYRQIAATDRDILSIHVATALSGTYNSAAAAAQLMPEANITVYDTKLVSGVEGWVLEAAGRCVKAGWSRERIIEQMEKIRQGSELVFTVPNLRYLIHGGRISHLKGFFGTALGIKPLIGVDNNTGKLTQAGQARTIKAAYEAVLAYVSKRHKPGSSLRLQLLHGDNLEGAEALKSVIAAHYDCTWMPTGAITPVLGAHTGPGLVGLFFGSTSLFDDIPGKFSGAH